MARARAIPASPRVPRITRLRRHIIRQQLERQSSEEIGRLEKPARRRLGLGFVEEELQTGVMAELAEPARHVAESPPRPYELQPESIAIIALLCTIAGILIGYIAHAKVIG